VRLWNQTPTQRKLQGKEPTRHRGRRLPTPARLKKGVVMLGQDGFTYLEISEVFQATISGK